MSFVRAVILADSPVAVMMSQQVLTRALDLKRVISPAWKHGASVKLEGEGTTFEILEIGWLSNLRRMRRAPSVGKLISLRWDQGPPSPAWVTAIEATFSDDPRSRPQQIVNLEGYEPAHEASCLLREVVLSTTGVEANASELRAHVLQQGGRLVQPGVIRLGSTDLRLQPLSSGTSALVLRCRSVDDTVDKLRDKGVSFSHVGRSGVHPGQISLSLPWTSGVEIRLCQKAEPEAQFYESHDAIVNAPDILPELQSPNLSGTHSGYHQRRTGDCWIEARATVKHQLRRPGRFFLGGPS